MIRLPRVALDASERYALDVLVDVSRLVPFDGEDAAHDGSVVRLAVTDDAGRLSLADCVAHRWPFVTGDGEVRVPRSLLTLVTEIAGAAAEQRSTARDRYERVPSTENPLVALGAERDPVISRAGGALRAAVIAAADRRCVRMMAPWPNGKRWAACFTHDVDVVQWWPLFSARRFAELAAKGEVRRAATVVASAVASLGASPVTRGVGEALAAEQGAALPSTWFFICGRPTFESLRAGDVTYAPESAAARRVVAMLGATHEIGLHASFATMENGALMASQRTELGRLANRHVAGVRQHYLRIRPGATQRAMCAAGFAYDASYGFADRNGFRLGVADVVPAWDAQEGRVMALAEVPLSWMDRAQSKYQGNENPVAWIDDALELAATCRAVEGVWVALWHPNLTTALGFPGAAEAYRRLVACTLEHDPFVATLGEIVRWRDARRATRAMAFDARGEPVLTRGASTTQLERG